MTDRRGIESWFGALLLAAILSTLLECVLMQMRFALFTGGYLNPAYVKGWQVPLFLLGSVWLDATAAALVLLPAMWITSRFPRLNRAQRLATVVLLCVLPVQISLFLGYSVHRHFGDVLQYHGILPGWNAKVLGTLVPLTVLAILGTVAYRFLRRVPDRWLARPGRTSWRRLLATAAILLLGAPVIVALAGIADERLQRQFVRKNVGTLVARLGTRITDFDGDGRGLVNTPFDYAPFDGRRYPFAVDWPGNGIDENGLNGDLDARGDFSHEHYPDVQFVRRPDVVIFVLESFRADNLTAEVDGRPVAPNIRRLVQRGAISGPAYSHNGYTIESLGHLFTGSLSLSVESSVIDDFNANGYLTACISGEDESFGGIATATGLHRADHFEDARTHVDERYTVSASSTSLALPWTVVARNVEEFLRRTRQDDRPLFLYVNLQDCHYPYYHEGLRRLIDSTPLTRADIVPENRERAVKSYRNSAANVDAAVGAILESWKTLRGGQPALLITGDHGESVFDNGTLGHGIDLTREQTRIPFVASGLPVECVFPVGLADVRRILRHALTRKSDVSSAVVDPDRWVFQFTGPMRGPLSIGAAYADRGVSFDFTQNAQASWGKESEHVPDLIRFWEQLRLRGAEAAGATPDDSN